MLQKMDEVYAKPRSQSYSDLEEIDRWRHEDWHQEPKRQVYLY